MKTIRIFAAMLVAVIVFTFSVAATQIVPSIEQIDEPELWDYDVPEGHEAHGMDELIITPIDHLIGDGLTLHPDIEESLTDAYYELRNELIHDLVEDFHEHWDRVTGGAPLDKAIITHLFDVRFRCELGGGTHGTTTVRAESASDLQLLSATVDGKTYDFVENGNNQVYSLDILEALTEAAETKGVEITFRVYVNGLDMDDDFLVVYRCSEQEHWADEPVEKYHLVQNNILEITGKTMAAYAIVQATGTGSGSTGTPDDTDPSDTSDPAQSGDPSDVETDKPQDGPDSPQTNVPGYFYPAIIGAIFFVGVAVVCVTKITKKNAA